MEDLYFDYWLFTIKGMTSRKAFKWLGLFGSSREIFYADEELLRSTKEIKGNIDDVITNRDEAYICDRYEKMVSRGIQFVSYYSSGYPEKLMHISNPPFGIFYRGRLPEPDKYSVAVVGARNASYSGVSVAKKLGRELAESGIQIISGLARGVDVNSQTGAMSIAGGTTYAVMGCGIDICYPVQHIEEYSLIQKNGGIISEYPPGVPPAPYNFPMRNRIISSLSDAVLVIEAGDKSGSLITAECALEQGRDVFVVPGAFDDPLYSGSNKLIKEGAALVTGSRDILDGLGIFLDISVTEQKKKNQVKLEKLEKIVYASLSLEPSHVSEIAAQTGMTVQTAMDKLLGLQLKGMVKMIGANYYALNI